MQKVRIIPEDLELHLPRAVIHTETGIDLIPANKRLADAAARLQVMQLLQYNTAGEAETLCEEVMDKLNISYSTYQKAHDDLLSTIAVFAAHYGEL